MTAYLDRVAGFAAEFPDTDIPDTVLDHARLVVADCIAACVGGAAEPEVAALTARLLPAGAGGPAAVLGAGRTADAGKAAFINGTAGTFLEMDEGNQYCRGHPGIHTVPAAIAWGQAHGVSGSSLLAAIVMGYEIGSRVGIAANLRPTMHPHGTWGAVCAAVAVGRMAGYDAGRMQTLLNVCSNMGLATSRRTMLEGGTVRNIFAGVGNQMGILAHDLVEAGFTGENDGLGNVFGKVVSETFDPSAMTEDLGSRWEIARNYFKGHSCCRYNHASLDALEMILAQRPGGIRVDEIDRVEVETYSLAVELGDRSPRNTLAGKFSVPFAIATTLINGNSGVASFTWDAIRNDEIQALAKKVEVREDPAMTAKMPDLRPAAVKVTLTDGTALTAATDTNKGDWQDPYTEPELAEKFMTLTTRRWTPAGAQAVHDEIMNLRNAPSLDRLTALIESAGDATEAVA